MKIALLADLHANLPALEAVLDHARLQGAEAFWNLGDFVGYGAFPNETVQRVVTEDMLGVIGNYDQKVLKFKRQRRKWKAKKVPEKWLAFQWAYQHLSKPSRIYLRKLPLQHLMEVDGWRVMLTHGSPRSIKEHLTPDTSEDDLRQIASIAAVDIILIGHSHIPFARQVDGTWFVNPGSVGRPDDGDPRAAYAILQFERGDFRTTHYRVEYDVQRAVAELQAQGLPAEFGRMLQTGRSLDGLRDTEGKHDHFLRKGTTKKMKSKPDPEDPERAAVIKLAQTCEYDSAHTHQVEKLALRLFDELKPLHLLGDAERRWLEYAAVLHDIGLVDGTRAHHKTALRMILSTPLLPFDPAERLIIGSVARYHRKALPSEKHDNFAALKSAERRIVSILASLLRIADGLDYSHIQEVRDLTCQVTPQRIAITCLIKRPVEVDQMRATEKGDLLRKVFHRELSVEMKVK